jgi:hypothetical protein
MPAPLSDERYQAMVDAHMEQPGNVYQAAQAAHCDWRIARRAWLEGLNGRPSIQHLVEEKMAMRRAVAADLLESQEAERQRVRLELTEEAAQLQSQLQAAADRTRADMAAQSAELQRQRADVEALVKAGVDEVRRTRARLLDRAMEDGNVVAQQELALTRSMRGFALSVFALLQHALKPDALENLGRAMARGALDGNIDPREAKTLFRLYAGHVKPLAETIKLVFEAERLRAGDPTTIVKHIQEVAVSTEELEAQRVRLNSLVEQLHELEADAEVEVLEQPPEPPALPGPPDPASAP